MAKLGWCSSGYHAYTDRDEPGLCPRKVGRKPHEIECDCDCHSDPNFVRPTIPSRPGDEAAA